MAGRTWQPVLEQIRSLAGRPDAPRGDGELLSQFVARGDEAAFEALLRRHGPMVLRVARRVLGGEADAEDVFQATFLLLARRAAAIRKRDSVASWLHGVAHRLALSVRAKNARRRERERRAAEARPTEAPAEAPWAELERTLHDAIARLPAKYRTPLVCCYLEGRTQEEVARDLGAPLGTLRSWVARGRELLRKQLLRRGISLSAGGAGAALLASACANAEAVPPALLSSTANAAGLFQRGENAMALLSPHVSTLVRQGMTSVFVAKIKSGVACLLVLAFAAAGMGWAAHRGPNAEAEKSDESPPKAAASEERLRTDAFGDPLPPGAVARFGSARFRHEGMLGSFVISPDGRTIAAVPLSFGKSVVFWDMATGRLTRRVTFDRDVHYVAFTPDGKSIVIGSGGVFDGHSIEEGILRFVDRASGKETRRLRAHSHGRSNAEDVGIWEAAFFTPDGRTMITVGDTGNVFRWDVPSGKKLGELHGGRWIAWGLSSDGELLAARDSSKENILRLLETGTGKEVRQLSHSDPVHCAAFSPDGKTLATSCSKLDQGRWKPGKITLWRVEDGKELGTLLGHEGPVPALAFSPDGKTLASGGRDRLLCLWDVAAQKQLHKSQLLPTSIMQLAFSPDGKTILSRGKENRLRLWDVAAWRERPVAEGPGQAIWDIAYSRDGKMVASVSANNDSVWLWEAATGKPLRTFEYASAPLRFSEDGKSLTAGSGFSHLRVWDTASGNIKQTIPIAGSLGGRVVMSRDGKTIAAVDRARLSVFGIGPQERPRPLKVPSDAAPDKERDKRRRPLGRPWLFAACFSYDNKTLYACSSETHVLRWDVATGHNLPSIGNQDDGANGIAVAPDGRSVATVTANGALHLWETASRQPRLVIKDKDLAFPIAYAPHGRLLALASKKEEVVQLVRVTDGKVIRRFTGHIGGIFSLNFSPDGRTLASGGHDSTVLLWDVVGLAAVDARNAPVLKPEKLAELWIGLRGTAAESYDCMIALTASPTQAVPFLAEKMASAAGVDSERLARLLKKLDSDDFREREEAMGELKKLGDAAEPALRQALHRKPTLESRRRLQQLLDDLDAAGNVSSERLRSLRAIEVLERIGDKQARDVLRRLSAGAEGAWLTEEAQRTLRRLN